MNAPDIINVEASQLLDELDLNDSINGDDN